MFSETPQARRGGSRSARGKRTPATEIYKGVLKGHRIFMGKIKRQANDSQVICLPFLLDYTRVLLAVGNTTVTLVPKFSLLS
nr:hypothetical protein [Sutcliffiella halmapala]